MPTARIALDAFGGDHCPGVEVRGAVAAARAGVAIVLVGDEALLEAELEAVPDRGRLPLSIHHAPDRITMDDVPGRAVRNKPNASMPVCFDLVKGQGAEAAMSAGNSGAMLACGLFKYRRLKGVDRPAIVTTLPNRSGVTHLLDVGANVDCRPLNLVQFALMGAAYARFKQGTGRPRVGVLSNGTEEGKGTDLTRATHQVLAGTTSDDFVYAGYVEGEGLLDGNVDVVVSDGFTGNIALKVAEATGRLVGGWVKGALTNGLRAKLGAALLRPALADLRRRLNPDTYGAAPLLGVDGVAFLCHGGASVEAIATALQLAERSVHEALMPQVAECLARHLGLMDAARDTEPRRSEGRPEVAKPIDEEQR